MRGLYLQAALEPSVDLARVKGASRRDEGAMDTLGSLARPHSRPRVAGGLPTQILDDEYRVNLGLEAALKREEEARRLARRAIAAPAFLGNKYKPRNLTTLGGDFMREMDPEGPMMRKIYRPSDRAFAYQGADPLRIPGDLRASLDNRYDFLARRYTGLDLVRRGLALEILGRFYPLEARDRVGTIRRVLEERLEAAGWHDRQSPLDEQDLRIWLAMGRRVTWDQVFALNPAKSPGLFMRLQSMGSRGEIEQIQMPFGKGQLGGLSLTKKGWKTALEEDPDLESRGFGPQRKTVPGQEYHDSAVVDAIQYGTHLVEADGGRVLGVTLEDGLKREAPDRQLGVADFRLELINKFGTRTFLEVEVMGVARYHYSPQRRESGSSGFVRLGFDPLGRSGDAGTNIRIGR